MIKLVTIVTCGVLFPTWGFAMGARITGFGISPSSFISAESVPEVVQRTALRHEAAMVIPLVSQLSETTRMMNELAPRVDATLF